MCVCICTYICIDLTVLAISGDTLYLLTVEIDSSSQGTVGRQTPQSQQNGSQKARTCDDEGDATPGNDCHENSNMDVDGTKYPTHKSTYPTTDCVRLKCRQLMRSALESGSECCLLSTRLLMVVVYPVCEQRLSTLSVNNSCLSCL